MAKSRDDVLRRMLKTPPTPHKEKPKAAAKKVVKQSARKKAEKSN